MSILKKADLRTGMVVTLRNGTQAYVFLNSSIGDCLQVIKDNCITDKFIPLDMYKDTLHYVYGTKKDIVSVLVHKHNNVLSYSEQVYTTIASEPSDMPKIEETRRRLNAASEKIAFASKAFESLSKAFESLSKALNEKLTEQRYNRSSDYTAGILAAIDVTAKWHDETFIVVEPTAAEVHDETAKAITRAFEALLKTLHETYSSETYVSTSACGILKAIYIVQNFIDNQQKVVLTSQLAMHTTVVCDCGWILYDGKTDSTFAYKHPERCPKCNHIIAATITKPMGAENA